MHERAKIPNVCEVHFYFFLNFTKLTMTTFGNDSQISYVCCCYNAVDHVSALLHCISAHRKVMNNQAVPKNSRGNAPRTFTD